MTKPTTRGFEQAKRLGDSGEATVAVYLAQNAEGVAAKLGAPVEKILVKLDTRYHREAFEETVGTVKLEFVPTPKDEQARGDLVHLPRKHLPFMVAWVL